MMRDVVASPRSLPGPGSKTLDPAMRQVIFYHTIRGRIGGPKLGLITSHFWAFFLAEFGLFALTSEEPMSGGCEPILPAMDRLRSGTLSGGPASGPPTPGLGSTRSRPGSPRRLSMERSTGCRRMHRPIDPLHRVSTFCLDSTNTC